MSDEGINFFLRAIDQTAGAVKSAIDNLQKLAEVGTNAGESVEQASELGAAGLSKWAGVAAIAGTVITTSITATKKAYEFSKEGASLERLQTSFTSVAKTYGTSSNAILLSMRSASRGTIADTDIMMAANRAMLLGVSTNADELGKITEVAIARGKAMGLTSAEAIDRVYTGIGRLSPKILDDLGIITNATQRYEEYAKAHGIAASAIDDMTKREIIKQAIIEGSSELVKNTADDDAASYERISASWTNLKNSFKLGMADTFTGPNNFIAGVMQNAANTQNQTLTNKAALGNYAASIGRTYREMFSRSGQANAALASIASEAKTAREDTFSGSAQTTKPGGGGFTQDMQMSLEGGMALTDMTNKYSAKTAELNAKLAEEQATLVDLAARGYPETSDKVQEHTEKVNTLKQAIVQNNAAQIKSQKEYASSVLKSKEASTEQQMAFAVASGQITQGAANQELAQQKLADAFMTGGISATTYASQIAAVMQKVNTMDGKHANAYIDVWIREHTIGVSYGGGFFAGNDTATTKNEAKDNHQISGRAAGGMLTSGWTLVGDRPGGVLTPYSELISPWGYVYDAKMTKKLIETGAVQMANSRAVGGDTFINGGGSGSALSRSRGAGAARTFSRSKSQRGGAGKVGIASTAAVAGADEVTQSAADVTQSQVSLSNQIQNQANAVIASNTIVSSKLDELIGVMLDANPSAIGKKVGYEIAKVI